MSSSQNPGNLSDTRGNHGGIAFFRLLIRCCGRRVACGFAWFIAFFYALLDGRAFASSRPYLSSRFPEATWLGLRIHFFRLIVSQGQAMIVAYWLQIGNTLPVTTRNNAVARAELEKSDRGLILLISHVGCWQASLRHLLSFSRPINLLIQANRNTGTAALLAGSNIRIIDNSSEFGGLLECVSALERGEIVCIMGDRHASQSESSLTMDVLGNTREIPSSPWYLAAKCNVPILPLFVLLKPPLASAVEYRFVEPMKVKTQNNRRPSNSDFLPAVRQYARELEDIATESPYQVFHYSLQKGTKNG